MGGESKVHVIDVGGTDKLPNGGIALVNAAGKGLFFTGACTTRATVLSEAKNAAIGAIYTSSAGKQYIKVANAAAATDWARVTATAAD